MNVIIPINLVCVLFGLAIPSSQYFYHIMSYPWLIFRTTEAESVTVVLRKMNTTVRCVDCEGIVSSLTHLASAAAAAAPTDRRVVGG